MLSANNLRSELTPAYRFRAERHRKSKPILSPAILEKIVSAVALLYIYCDVFGGVVRYAFHSVGLTFLTYIPSVIMVGMVALAILVNGATTKFDRRICLVAGCFALFSIYSLLIGRSPLAVLFALYGWSPFFLGMLVVRHNLFPKIAKQIFLLLVVSIAGIVISSLFSVPWALDDKFSVGGVEVGVTKVWRAAGVIRLPGFSRASTTAANDIQILLLWFICLRRPLWLKIVLWAVCLYAVVLTTSKTPLIVLAVGPPLLFLQIQLSRLGPRWRFVWHSYSSAVLSLLLALMIVPPYLEISKPGRQSLPFVSALSFFRMDSFAERVNWTWPRAFLLLHEGHAGIQSVFGRGIGGLGMGQLVGGEANMHNPADNLHIYLYVTFGFLSFAFWAVLLYGNRRALSGRFLDPAVHFANLIAVLGLGTLTPVIEGPIPTVVLGMLISVCLAPVVVRPKVLRESPRSRAPFMQSTSDSHGARTDGPDFLSVDCKIERY